MISHVFSSSSNPLSLAAAVALLNVDTFVTAFAAPISPHIQKVTPTVGVRTPRSPPLLMEIARYSMGPRKRKEVTFSCEDKERERESRECRERGGMLFRLTIFPATDIMFGWPPICHLLLFICKVAE